MTPDWILERVAHGELAEAKREDLERLEALRAANRTQISELPPLSRLEARLSRARDDRSARFRTQVALAAPLLAGAVGLVLFLRPEAPRAVGEAPEITRIKGDARLLASRKTSAGAEALPDGAVARAGDVLQLGYAAASKRFGVVVSLDGRGAVTLHLPESPGGSTELQRNGELPHAYRLDDAPSFERFVLVTADHPVDVTAVLAAARALAPDPAQAQAGTLPLPPEFSQSSLLVRKAGP